jgi:hypothetical protein
MSKKTFFKRIALIAIAALGFGTISMVPSNAIVTSHTLTIDAAADSVNVGDTATATLTHNFVNLGSAYDSVVLTAVVTSSNAASAGTINFTVTDSFTSTANDASDTNSPIYGFGNAPLPSGSSANATFASTASYSVTRDSLTIAPSSAATRNQGSTILLRMYNAAVAGTYTVTVFTQTSNAGAALASATPSVTWTVTVTQPSQNASAESTATLRLGAPGGTAAAGFGGTVEGTDSSVVTSVVSPASLIDTTAEASIYVVQKNTSGTDGANNARESFTVTVSGEAFVTTGTTRPTASGGVKSLVFASAAAGSATPVYLWSTGTAGTATVTITTASGQAIGGSKTLTFHGDVTTLALSRELLRYLPAATSTGVTAFRVLATDAGGRGVTGLTVTTTSSNTSAVASGGTCSELSAITSAGVYVCTLTPVITSTSGMTSTIVARTVDPAVTTSTSYLTYSYGTVTMGGAVNTATITFDKATYAPGEAMRITVTAKDSSGNIPYDAISGFTLTANKAIGGTITMNSFYDGVSDTRVRSTTPRTFTATENLFAPAASGEFKVTGTFTNAAGVSTLISGTAKVSDDAVSAAANAATDAALEAIDAANAATDAANLAAEAADAATVAAEEARDAADAATAAVEALAKDIADLTAGIRAQITTLANTVAKIAKKVKA